MKKLNLFLLTTILIYNAALADEGMWLPSLIYKLNISQMQKMGLELSAEDIYSINSSSLKDAVVALDYGSCTAELVSNDGLLLTNHHCGFDEIQKHSSVDHDYLRDGFWAMSREEELPNPGKTVTFLIKIEDVTDKVLAEVTHQMTEEQREKEINIASYRIEREEKESTNYDAQVKSFFNSNKFYLFVTETFKDIRLVGAPPQALGKFGGDTDNWMWPRQTNDFSMFRIYCGPDGKPAEYSEENVPYHPKHFLPISLKGVENRDFAMILGYPGGTDRYATSFSINNTMRITNDTRIAVRGKLLNIWADYMSTSQKAKIQYAAKYAGSSNYYKYSIGQNVGLTNLNVIEKKKAIENEFMDWVNNNPDRKDKYGNALSLIEESYENKELDKANAYFSEALFYSMSEAAYRGPEIFLYAYRLRWLADMLKDPEKNKEDIQLLSSALKRSLNNFYKDYDAATDEKVAAAMFKLYADSVPSNYYPTFLTDVKKKYKNNFEKFAKVMFQKSMFDDESELSAFLDNPSLKKLEKDMAYTIASEIYRKNREFNALTGSREEQRKEGERLFLAGLMEMHPNKNYYPDANSTMRLTYGQVMDYEPRDGVIYNYYTTTDGYLEKEIPGDYEFNVPARMKELVLDKDFGRYADNDGQLRTCFITNNDITGGNSGSPVINKNGELIGIAFDGNWEAMSGDIAFEPELQRSINVDIRFVLWVIDIYAGAGHLIDEMKIIQ